MNSRDLDDVLETLNEDECIRFFSKMDEKQRKALSERSRLWHTVSSGCNFTHPEMTWWIQFLGAAPKNVQKMFARREEARKLASQLPPVAQKPEAIKVTSIAMFATCNFTDLKKLDAFPDAECAYKLIVDRKPRWTKQFAYHVLENEPKQYWEIIRRMEKSGELSIEHDSTYLGGMALGLNQEGLFEALLEDPQLIDEVMRMVDDHSAMGKMLSQMEEVFRDGAYTTIGTAGMRWKSALCKLASEGSISKDRLLKSVTSTLTRLALENSDGSTSIPPRWFIEVHRDLRPDLDDHRNLLATYCTALRSRSDWALRWSIGQVKDLSDCPECPLGDACDAMAEVFLTKGKENSQLAIDCLKAIAKERESERSSVASCAAEALSHSSPDIQKQAIILIEKFGDKKNIQLLNRLNQQIEYITVLNRERLAKWLPQDQLSSERGESHNDAGAVSNVIQLSTVYGAQCSTDSTDEVEIKIASLRESIQEIPEMWLAIAKIQAGFDALDGDAIDLESVEFDGTEFPRLDDENKIEPIHDLDELVFSLSRTAHDRSNSLDGNELERILDGISRLNRLRPPDFAQRTVSINSFSFGPHEVQRALVMAWLDKGFNMATVFNPFTNGMPFQGSFADFGVSSNPVDRILASRCRVAARRISKGIAKPFLAAPTHRGGWIDPLELVKRVIEGAHLSEHDDVAEAEREEEVVQSMQQSNQQSMMKKLTEMIPGALGQPFFDKLKEQFSKPLNFAIPSISNRLDGNISEQSIALLRLAPEGRDEALRILDNSYVKSCEFVDALRYALGADDAAVGKCAPLWVAAARSRAPFEDDPRIESEFPGLGPDCGKATRYSLSLTKNEHKFAPNSIKVFDRDPEDTAGKKTSIATQSMHYHDVDSFTTHYQYVDWSATMWPLCLEPFFAIGAEQMANTFGSSDTSGSNKFLEPLYDPDVPVKSVAMFCIALGLTGKAKDENGAAVEALIQCIDDGRVNGNKLGETLHQLFAANAVRGDDTPLVILQRWIKALRTVAQASSYHARVVAIALEHLLHGDPDNAPKALHSALELLLELLMQEQQSLSLSSSRNYLSDLKTSGKTRKIAKQLLSLKQESLSTQRRREALLYALERRVERLQRWQRRGSKHSVNACK